MHRGNGRPRVHARDHEHGGADPTLIVYEDVGDPGSGGGSGIQFVTYPQAGEWLYVETDGAGTSPSGFGVEVFDDSGNGIDLACSSGGQVTIQTSGGGDILVQATSGSIRLVTGASLDCVTTTITMASLPTSDPGVPGQLWNDTGTVKVSL